MMKQLAVTADNAGPNDENGLPLTCIKGARFGQAMRTRDYPRPRPGLECGRTLLMSMGVRYQSSQPQKAWTDGLPL